jgi:O-antigen ligase
VSASAAELAAPREDLHRLLARVARGGLYLHAAMLPVSIAGMQVGLWGSAIALGALLATGARPLRRSPLDLPVLALCAAAVLSQVIAFSWVGGFVSVMLWRSFLAPLIVLAVLACEPRRARQDALRLLAVWMCAALLPAIVAWPQHLTGLDPLFELGLREKPIRGAVKFFSGRYGAMGFFTWYQRLAQNLAPPLLLAAALLVLGGAWRRGRVPVALALAAITAAVGLTFARSAWFGLAAALLVLAALSGRRRAAPVLGATALAGVGLLAGSRGVRERLLSSFQPGANVDREGIWNVCRVLYEEHPLRGWGFGNLPVAGKATWWKLYPVGTVRSWCHDQFFSSLVEGGPLLLGATLLYFVALPAAFWRWRSRPDALGRAACAGALAAIAFMAVNALVHDVFYASEPMYGFGFALGIAAALARSGEPPAEAA